MGIHTGESVVVAPILTLRDDEYQMMRTAAIHIIRALDVQGGCNIQFAFKDGEYRVIEVNPRVSRSSVLASKTPGTPSHGSLQKLRSVCIWTRSRTRLPGVTAASFEPTIDYVVVKVPRWPFDKFKGADRAVSTSMKSTRGSDGDRENAEEAFMKAETFDRY